MLLKTVSDDDETVKKGEREGKLGKDNRGRGRKKSDALSYFTLLS